MTQANFPQHPDRHYEFISKGVVIIGAGIAGILQAIDLLKRGIDNFTILEKSSNVGGTWLQNTYPGCQCDIVSVLYSISFEQNPLWSRVYPGQEEMLDYLIKVASKYDLHRYIRFNSHVNSVQWDDVTSRWKTSVRVVGLDSEHHSEYTISSDFLVAAVGQLNQPSYPDIKGLDSFEGKLMHSARWDWTFNMQGKRVAILGSGPTAVQIIPELAGQVSHLTVHQRTPNWIIHRMDGPIPDWKKAVYSWIPFTQHRVRALQMDVQEWLHGFVRRDQDTIDVLKEVFFSKLNDSFPNDPEMRAKLTPNYVFGCKRILVTDDYLPALARPNVRLETDPIVEVTATGISVSRGDGLPASHEEVDALVLATGFRSVEFMHPIEATGRNGRPLKHIWAGGASAFNGVTVEDMPNFGMLYGPNTNLGHNSIVLMEESQATYIGTLAEAVLDSRNNKRSGATATTTEETAYASTKPLSLCPKKSVVDAYNMAMQEGLDRSAFADPNCRSWYKDPKTGKITNNWHETVVEYQKRLERVAWADYEGGEEVVRRLGGQDAVLNPRVQEESSFSNPALLGMGVCGLAAAGTLASFLLRNSKGFSQLLRA